MKTYLHKNPHSRGFGLSIVFEGTLVITARFWAWDLTVYHGVRFVPPTYAQYAQPYKDRIEQLERQLAS